jgi:hypothetical protein
MSTVEPKKPRYSKKSPGRGGARANSGRKKGATTKISIESLMAEIELQSGRTYAELLTHNYVGAISRSDWNGVRDYDKAFMNKMIAERMAVEVNSPEDAVEAKQAAFATALAQLAQITSKTKTN